MNRKLFWAVLVIGLALVLAPFALSMPGKTAAGQRMLNGFQPIMQPSQVATTAHYYIDVFVPLGKVTPMMSAQNRHFQPGACGPEALPPARHDDAGQREQLRAGQQPAGLQAVHMVLRRSGPAARASCRLRPLRAAARGEGVPPPRAADTRVTSMAG
jgi:hypothetical protein